MVYNYKIEQHHGVLGAGDLVDFCLCVPKGVHFGIPFFVLAAPWAPLGGSVSPNRDFGGGRKWNQKLYQKGAPNGGNLSSILVMFSGPNREEVVFVKHARRLRNNHVFEG